MGKLIYSAIASLDGYVEDEHGNFDWAAPDEEVHRFVNDLERSVGTYLYGRRMYETMVFWETVSTAEDPGDVSWEFARIWRAAEKIVFSTRLTRVSSERTRLQTRFDARFVEHLKQTSPADITVGGPELAAQALKCGLVDECHLFLHPVTVGAGKRALPPGLALQLLAERRFRSGVIHLHYRVDGGRAPDDGNMQDVSDRPAVS